MISILCLSCNAIFSAVSFRGQHAEVGDFLSLVSFSFFFFWQGGGSVVTFLTLSTKESLIEMNG